MKTDICASHHRGNPESVAANEKAEPHKADDRSVIYVLLEVEGPCTCKEIEYLTGMKHQTCSARLSELKADGWVVKTGRRREGAAEVRAVTQQEREANHNAQGSLYESHPS